MTAIAPLTAEPLWQSARAMFARMRAAIGAAAALAERIWIGPEESKEIRSWLNPLIAMARRLVLIEAIALARASAPPRKPAPHAKRASAAKRAASWPLRLWPKRRRAGPRARQLGLALLVRDIWRERAHAAAAAQLNKARFMRPAPQLQLARRIEALAAILARPLHAARRLARKLRASMPLALKLIRPLPRTRRYKDEAYRDSGNLAFDDAVRWLYADTS